MFDFRTPKRVGQLGVETDTNVFVVRDMYSGVWPTPHWTQRRKWVRCLKEFMGRRKIRVAYGGHAPQFVHECQKLGARSFAAGKAQEQFFGGEKQSLRGERTLACPLSYLHVTGLFFLALPSTCHLLSAEIVDGESAWYNLHGDRCEGPQIPFGGRDSQVRTKINERCVCWVRTEWQDACVGV